MVRDMFSEINLDGQQQNLGEETNPRAKLFYEMYAKAQRSLKPGHPTTLLQWASTIVVNKSANRETQTTANGAVGVGLMSVDHEYKHTLLQDWRSVKKLMLSLGLSYRTYDFRINHCYLYYKDVIHRDTCPTCGASRYEENKGKGKRVANIKLWFFPLTERLQRLYMSRKTVEHMTWHASKCCSDPIIHPVGSEQWAHFEETFPDFANEIQNVRLGLCANGFDPNHGKTTDPHSIWLVFITPYNLPPDLAMRPELIFLTILLEGPEDPTHDINVMLRSMVDELIDLWTHGAVTYDSYKKHNFIMKAALMCTINDFLAYGMLSGWSTHRKLACLCCMQNTDSFKLRYSQNPCWFDCHMKFLPLDHLERRNKNDYIKDRTVRDLFPEQMLTQKMVQQVASLPNVTFGKMKYIHLEGFGVYHNWTKRNIFWELIYWPYLCACHNLDVMHAEKNCLEQVHVTVFNLGRKSKDNLNSRRDLKIWTNRSKLFLDEDEDSKSKPKDIYILAVRLSCSSAP